MNRDQENIEEEEEEEEEEDDDEESIDEAFLAKDDDENKYPEYGSPDYWDQRYKEQDDFYDWYMHWNEIGPAIEKYLNRTGKTLVIGCGNSLLSKELYDDNFTSILSTDISPSVIQKMSELYKNEKSMEWKVMDCSKMDLPDSSIDTIFDKGTFDALVCADDQDLVPKTLEEVYRVLKPGGKLFLVTFGGPSQRIPLIRKKKYNWTLHPVVELHCKYLLPTEQGHFVFILEKNRE